MSTVLPPAAALPLLVALPLLLLLLLLQPTAARAIAAKAAIAVVRLMIFLSSFEVVRLPRSVVTGLVRAHGRAAAGMAGLTKSLRRLGRPGRRFRHRSRAGRTSRQAPQTISPPWRRADLSAAGLLNSGLIGQHVLGEAHRQALIRMDTGLDLPTISTDPTRAHKR